MIVRRDRGATLAADRERTRRLVADVRTGGEAGLRVWTPPAHVSFGRRDANADGYDRARTRAAERGYPTAVRESGGRAVAHTAGTLAIVVARPVVGERAGIRSRYDDALVSLQDALEACGVAAERGEPPRSFCPGSHSLQVDGRKVAGLAQRVRREVAILAGIVVVHEEAVVADVLAPVYDALGVPFDPKTVGSVALGGGDGDPARVGDAVVATFRER